MKNVKYPPKAIEDNAQGRVMVAFVIEKSGVLSTIEVLQSPHQSLSEEVINVLLRSPKWTPATHKGEPARVKFTLPVEFAL